MSVHYGGSQTTPSKKSSSGNKQGQHANGMKAPSKFKTITKGTLADPKEKDDYLSGAMDSIFSKQGAANIENLTIPSLLGTVLKPLFKVGSEKTRDYFTDKVLNQKRGFTTKSGRTIRSADWKTMTHTEREGIFKSYMEGRMSGRTDAYGNVYMGKGEGAGASPSSQKKSTTTSGTTGTTGATGSQVATTEKKEELIARGAGTKKSSTIMTSVAGLEDEANVSQATLGGTIMRNKKKKYA